MSKKEVRVYTRKIAGYDALHYVYSPSHDVTMLFNQLCEVGEPWKKEAEAKADRLAKRQEREIRTVEIDQKPWIIEVLV